MSRKALLSLAGCAIVLLALPQKVQAQACWDCLPSGGSYLTCTQVSPTSVGYIHCEDSDGGYCRAFGGFCNPTLVASDLLADGTVRRAVDVNASNVFNHLPVLRSASPAPGAAPSTSVPFWELGRTYTRDCKANVVARSYLSETADRIRSDAAIIRI